MKYTVRFAHMFEPSPLNVGDSVRSGDVVGIMGTSGQSEFNHLHMDVIEGHHKKIIRLKKIGDNKKFKPSEKQLNFFNDSALFEFKPFVTTPYMDPEYKKIFGKEHPALDLVPEDRHRTNEHFRMYWNRSKVGTVLATGFDKGGYGNYILIGFEA